MDRMIPPDAETIPVTGDNPDAELGTAGLQPRSNSRGPAMDRMHAIGIHIIREPAATANPGYYNNVLPGYPQSRHDLLHLGEDDIIPASRAPANFLISGKVLGCQGL